MTTERQAFEEGKRAAAERKPYSSQCPYTFGNLGVTQEVFDCAYRPLMNAWFKGWYAWLEENNLDHRFRPKDKP